MDVVIIGAGGHGRVVLDILRTAGEHNVVGFIDADPALTGKRVGGLPVFGPLNQLPKLKQQRVGGAIVAIGDNRARDGCSRKVAAAGFELVNAVHPSAVISPTATLGKNVVVAAGAVVSTDAVVADNVILNTGCIVDHECGVAASAHICPGAKLAGRVTIGTGAFVGLGACVIPCIVVGEGATVGAGAVVIADVPAHATVVGVPARVIKVSPQLAAG